MAKGGPVLMAKGGILLMAEIGILYLTIYNSFAFLRKTQKTKKILPYCNKREVFIAITIDKNYLVVSSHTEK